MRRTALLLAIAPSAGHASAASPPPVDGKDVVMDDPLLDKLVGHWPENGRWHWHMTQKDAPGHWTSFADFVLTKG